MFSSSFESQAEGSTPSTKSTLEILQGREDYIYYQPPSRSQGIPDNSSQIPVGEDLGTHDGGPLSSGDRVLGCITLLCSKLLSTKRAFVCFADDTHGYLVADSTKMRAWLSAWVPGGEAAPVAEADMKWTLRGGDMELFEATLDLSTYKNDDKSEKLLEVNDLWECGRYSTDKWSANWPAARYYAGVPLSTISGITTGALCILDDEPRVKGISEVDRAVLHRMGSAVMDYLDIIRLNQEAKQNQRMELSLSRFMAGSFSSDRAVLTGQSDGSLHIESSLQETGRLNRERTTSHNERTRTDTGRHVTVTQQPTSNTNESTGKRVAQTCSISEYPKPISELPQFSNGLDEPPPLHRNPSNPDYPLRTPNSSRVRPKFTRNLSSSPFGTSFLSNPSQASCRTSPRSNSGDSDEKSCSPYHTLLDRASLLIRHALEVDGVVFLSPELDGTSHWGVADGGYSVGHDGMEGYVRGDDARQARMNCMSWDFLTPDPPQDFTFDVSGLDGDFLTRLCKLWPKGHIFKYSDSSQSCEATLDNVSLRGGLSGVGQQTMAAEVFERFRRSMPGSRSTVFVPLYDFVGKVFAVGLCWTTSEVRCFRADVEGGFMIAFGDAVMAEVSRLHAVSGEVSKGKFISSISHELRSPLHGALAASELLMDTELCIYQRGLMATIHSCSRTLLDTINHILAYTELNPASHGDPRSIAQRQTLDAQIPSRAKTSGLNATVENVDLAELIEDAVEAAYAGQVFVLPRGIYQKPAEKKCAVSVVIDVDPKLADLKVTLLPEALRRLVLNLCVNAFKYTPKGWVAVRLTVKEVDPKAGSKKNQYAVALTVADSGVGISREYLRNNLFTPFVQEDDILSGMGLGLSIVRQIVDEMDATIDVKSRVGDGTEVLVGLTLERSLTLLPTTENRLALFRSRLRNKRVCIGGFDQPPIGGLPSEVEALRIGYISLENTLTQILRMTIVDTSYQTATQREVDFAIVLNGTELNKHIANISPNGRKPKGTIPQRSGPGTALGPPLIALCSQVSRDETSQKPPGVCLVTEPHGPRKVAFGLIYALDQWESKRIKAANSSHVTGKLGMRTTEIPPSLQLTPLQKSLLPSESSYPLSVSPSSPPFSSPPLALNGVSSAAGYPSVLIVEDNIINMMLLSAFVSKCGHPFATTTNGQEAYQAVQLRPGGFDVILMDLQMPVMSGIESTAAIRTLEADRQDKRCVIVALTGLSDEGSRLAAFTAGIDRYLVKPVVLQVLGTILKDVCRDEA